MESGLRKGYLARNDYFIVTLTGFIYRLDTWESYTHCTEILFANLEKKDNSAFDIKFKYFSELAKKFISRLDQPEDWKRPYRYCVARYARQILTDDVFSETLHYNKDINDRYIYRYTMISRLKKTALIKRLNLLTYEEKKQLFILKDWEKKAYRYEDIFYGVSCRSCIYMFLNDKELFERDYKRYEAEFERFSKEIELFR
ncbi:hypothetical protein [Snodgrassella alvi]|uniref:hypothetical protein n=1 Tax=Snodgrassella alvi TaxID=1196083 RepID=UPI000C1EFF09|nr:hypothetical protein [Snodgrassella alvi]PIT34511.1 hypothetical protein BHC50_01865 [Snodgrassella alvi]PIT36000.1 hypothetical protein BHC42_04355 [Snodgrassella alvi]WLT05053.1 hypothetical protein RAM23_04000 [Snodgrassella alvi]